MYNLKILFAAFPAGEGINSKLQRRLLAMAHMTTYGFKWGHIYILKIKVSGGLKFYAGHHILVFLSYGSIQRVEELG